MGSPSPRTGAQKVLGWWGGPGFAGWTGGIMRMGLRPARLWAAISAGIELFGGLLLALGFLTPIASAFLVAQSTYIVVRAHLPRGFWNSGGRIEFPLQLLAGSLLVVASGPGAIAIDPALGVDLGAWWRAGSLHSSSCRKCGAGEGLRPAAPLRRLVGTWDNCPEGATGPERSLGTGVDALLALSLTDLRREQRPKSVRFANGGRVRRPLS